MAAALSHICQSPGYGECLQFQTHLWPYLHIRPAGENYSMFVIAIMVVFLRLQAFLVGFNDVDFTPCIYWLRVSNISAMYAKMRMNSELLKQSAWQYCCSCKSWANSTCMARFSTYPRDNHGMLKWYRSTLNSVPIPLHSSLKPVVLQSTISQIIHTFHCNF